MQRWRKVVLGIHSGLKFLDARYSLDPSMLWSALEGALTAQDVDLLVLDAKSSVKEYGVALAGSFYADLGSTKFVKPDTHVVACSSASSNAPLSEQASVAAVHRLADQSGRSPRAIDKLMFLACSRRFLVGGPPRYATEGKARLLKELRGMHPSTRI